MGLTKQHQELKSGGEYPNGNCRSCWNATAPGTSQTEPCPDLPDLAFRTVSNISSIVYRENWKIQMSAVDNSSLTDAIARFIIFILLKTSKTGGGSGVGLSAICKNKTQTLPSVPSVPSKVPKCPKCPIRSTFDNIINICSSLYFSFSPPLSEPKNIFS